MGKNSPDLVDFVHFTTRVADAAQHLEVEADIYAAVESALAASERFDVHLHVADGASEAAITGRINALLAVDGEAIGFLSAAAPSPHDGFDDALRGLAAAISARVESVRARVSLDEMVETLRRMEERSRILSETMSDFVYALRTQPDGTLVREWTAGDIKRLTGYTLEEMDARGGVMSIVHPDDREIVIRRAFALTSKHPYKAEYRIIDKAGRVRWIRYYTHPLSDEEPGSETRIYGAAQDITGAVESEQSLRASEERYRSLVETISEVIYEFDADGVMSYVSPAVVPLLGYLPEDLIGRSFRDFVLAEDRSRVARDFSRVLSGEGGAGEYRIQDKSGQTHWVRTTTQPVYVGGELTGVRGVLVDVTQRVRADEELRAYRDRLELLVGQRTAELRTANKRLALLSQRLMHAQEDERRRIARELHDEIGQALTALRFSLQAAGKAHPVSAPQIKDGLTITERTLQQVRDLSLDLRPSLLDDLGLVPALRWYLDRQAQRTGLSIDFSADEPAERLPPELEVACFRFVQEAATNVVRHASATQVRVGLRRRGRELELTVEDDGVGFDVASTLENAVMGESIGLLSMQERAQLAGGRMDVVSAAGEGTVVRARFPVPVPEPGADAPESQT